MSDFHASLDRALEANAPPAASGYGQALEDVASWLETCYRGGSLFERAQMAAMLRLGSWRDDEPRRTAARDVPKARAEAEAWIRRDIELDRRAKAARAAAAAGAKPIHDYYGRPVGDASKSYVHIAAAFGMTDGSAARVYEHGADGMTRVRDGNGELLEEYPVGKRPRRQTRLPGHAFAGFTACLRCPGGKPLHPVCECGKWQESREERCYGVSITEGRRWHSWHKRDVRALAEAVESGAVSELRPKESNR